ncbi:hypothetical protein [Streptomyces cremeus]|uniref:pPIWI-RE three-gene island domain-containing protein n=1 Tax=Streptomyces cremeus TaxID=66881 RepID=A0ABV5P742_STRCM
MRDLSGWYQPLLSQLRPWPAEHQDIRKSLLCRVELGLRLLEKLDPELAPEGAWTLFGGYPFADAAGLASAPGDRLALTAARHLLWSMRRRRVWEQSLAAYLALPAELRGYRIEPGLPARRVEPPVAWGRFAVYDTALGALPAFTSQPLPVAPAGSHRFVDHRRITSVTLSEDLLLPAAPGHDLAAGRPGTPGPLTVPLRQLVETARWADGIEARESLAPGAWAERLSALSLDTRADDDAPFVRDADSLVLDGLTHLVGMVGAGKSTLMQLLAMWAARQGLRVTLVVGDTAEQLGLVERFVALGLKAAPVVGGTTREQHAQRLHRRLAGRGRSSLLSHQDPAFDQLSTACPLDALRHRETDVPLRFADAPCGTLRPVPPAEPVDDPDDPDDLAALLGQPAAASRAASPASPDRLTGADPTDGPASAHSCPLWSECPRHHASRELVDALIWVANPASLVQSPVPRQLNDERLRYLELACLRSDLMIVDEADRVQMLLDDMFAPSATLVRPDKDSWLDQLLSQATAEVARQGRLPLSDPDVSRWSSSLGVVKQSADKLLTRLMVSGKSFHTWVQIDYFSAWTLQERLLQEWFPTALSTERDEDGTEEADLESEAALYTQNEDGDPDVPAEDPAATPPTMPSGGASWAARRAEVNDLLDAYRDDPLGDRGPYGTLTDDLCRLTHDLLDSLNEKGTRTRVREVLTDLLRGAPGPDEVPPPPKTGHRRPSEPADLRMSPEWWERACARLEFTLILAALHRRLDRVTFLWPQVEAALRLDVGSNELMRRPPLDYAPLVPESPMGNVLGFEYTLDDRREDPDPDGRRPGTLQFFRCAGVGRELLLGLDRIGAAPERGASGPHVLLMSGTSWAGTSTRAHVLAPVRAVLKPEPRAVAAIGRSVFSTCFLYDDESGHPLYLSGQHPDRRDQVLCSMVLKLARDGTGGRAGPLKRELSRIDDPRRRRALLLVGSYKDAGLVADTLQNEARWKDRVRVLVADDARIAGTEGDAAKLPASVRRGDLASFADDEEAELLIAPLLAIERGHNILTVPQLPGESRVAAFGTVFFLARPHPVPHDLSLAVYAVNDWVTRFVRDLPAADEDAFGPLVRKAAGLDEAGRAFRARSRAVWRRLLTRPYMFSALADDEKTAFAWDQLVTIWQVIGRLVRGGVPARVVFVDAAFAPSAAAASSPVPPTGTRRREPGLLFRLREILAPYLEPPQSALTGTGPCPLPPASDRELVELLYRPLYDALCTIRPL